MRHFMMTSSHMHTIYFAHSHPNTLSCSPSPFWLVSFLSPPNNPPFTFTSLKSTLKRIHTTFIFLGLAYHGDGRWYLPSVLWTNAQTLAPELVKFLPAQTDDTQVLSQCHLLFYIWRSGKEFIFQSRTSAACACLWLCSEGQRRTQRALSLC